MSEVVLKVDDSGAHIVSAGSEFSSVYRMHSGAMPEPISVEPGGENRVLACVAVRAGTVLVTIVYADDSVYDDQSWEVFPGAPLKVLSSETPAEVTIEQIGSELPQVEALIADSGIAVPELEFLVLNAGTGIRLGTASASDVVLGWRDTRPLSGAPEEFTSSAFVTNGGAQFIANDPDFDGKPSVLWSEDQAGGYLYSAEDAGLWDFLGRQGEYLFMAIMKPPRDRGWVSGGIWRRSSMPAPGLDLYIEGGYRPVIALYDDGESYHNGLIGRDEIIEDGTPMVLILLKTMGGGIRLYRQGSWEILSSDGLSGAGAESLVRPILGIQSAAGIETNLKIADLRIWKQMPRDINEKISSYIDMAKSEYGVDDSYRIPFPWVTGAEVMLRANRGVVAVDDSVIYLPGGSTIDGSAVQAWADTRPEGGFYFDARGDEKTSPSLEASDEMGDHEVVRGYGASTSGGGHSLDEPSAAEHSIYTDEFTLGFVAVPAAAGTLRGGVIIATNNTSALDDVFVWRLTSSGQLYLFIQVDDSGGDLTLEASLSIGTQVFGRPFAFMAQLGNGSVKLEAWDLTSDAHYESVTPTTWAGMATLPDPLVLFDYPSYVNSGQYFEGKAAELFIHPERVPSSEVRNWISYAKRRYIGVDWSSL